MEKYKKIVFATPHPRNDETFVRLSNDCKGCKFVRIQSKKELNIDNLKLINPDIIFFPHWSWIIPKEIYSNFECVIFHMTDLPYGRGGSPLQNLVARGHKETMLSALTCVADLDAGPIYMKRKLSLLGSAEEILARASDIIGDMIAEIICNKPIPQAQQGEITTFKRRLPEDGNIMDLDSIEKCYDYIRMLDADGYPAAFIKTKNFIIEFKDASLEKGCVLANVKITGVKQ
jgi:methionyl-tRNA formyltransferase